MSAESLRLPTGDGVLRLRIQKNFESLEGAQQALREFLEAAGAGSKGLYHAELVLEELATNVIRHGGAGGPDAHPIELGVCVSGEEIILTIEDDGAHFNPLLAPEPLQPSRIEDARIGGLGIRMVRQAALGMQYERRAERNTVRVRIERM